MSPAFEDRDRKFPAQAEWLDQQNWRTLTLVKKFTLGDRVTPLMSATDLHMHTVFLSQTW